MVDLVAALQTDRAAQHGELLTRLSEANRQSQALAETTQSLRMSLASPKARGQWGERMADDVLRMAGLVEGVNYRRQSRLAGGHHPRRHVPPARATGCCTWTSSSPSTTTCAPSTRRRRARRRPAAKAFLRTCTSASRRSPPAPTSTPTTTLDYVLLFIPNESVYSFMHEHDPGLIDAALAQRVVLCSPFTLFAMLAVIRQAMDSFRLERRR